MATCPTFSCDDGRCLPIEQRCNRIIDCLNGEDEIECYMSEVSNMNNGKYKQADSNEIVKQADKIFDDKNMKNRKLQIYLSIILLLDHKFLCVTFNKRIKRYLLYAL